MGGSASSINDANPTRTESGDDSLQKVAIMNLSKLSIPDLRKLEAEVSAQIKKQEKSEIAQARIQIRTLAQNAGISLTDLLRTESQPAKSPGKSSKVKTAAKFRNPNDRTKEWTGRGRKPQWVKEWTKEGKSIELLRV